MTWEGVFFVLANISAVVGLITAGWAGYTGWRFRRERKKIKERLDALAHESKGQPVAIAVGLGKKIGDIRMPVKQYLENEGIQVAEIFSIAHTQQITEHKAYEVVRELLEIKQQANQLGPTQIHFFYGGPIPLAVALGAVLDNWVPTILYHFDEGSYHPMMRLDKFLTAGAHPTPARKSSPRREAAHGPASAELQPSIDAGAAGGD
jgi:hypothetical protein